jgi:putative nucleotide binding protein
MRNIIKERERKQFESFTEIQNRVGLRDLPKLVAKRIVDEIAGDARMNLFVRK